MTAIELLLPLLTAGSGQYSIERSLCQPWNFMEYDSFFITYAFTPNLSLHAEHQYLTTPIKEDKEIG